MCIFGVQKNSEGFRWLWRPAFTDPCRQRDLWQEVQPENKAEAEAGGWPSPAGWAAMSASTYLRPWTGVDRTGCLWARLSKAQDPNCSGQPSSHRVFLAFPSTKTWKGPACPLLQFPLEKLYPVQTCRGNQKAPTQAPCMTHHTGVETGLTRQEAFLFSPSGPSRHR
jgi:hypothetical protein